MRKHFWNRLQNRYLSFLQEIIRSLPLSQVAVTMSCPTVLRHPQDTMYSHFRTMPVVRVHKAVSKKHNTIRVISNQFVVTDSANLRKVFNLYNLNRSNFSISKSWKLIVFATIEVNKFCSGLETFRASLRFLALNQNFLVKSRIYVFHGERLR